MLLPDYRYSISSLMGFTLFSAREWSVLMFLTGDMSCRLLIVQFAYGPSCMVITAHGGVDLIEEQH